MLVLIVIVIEVAVCCRINQYLLFVCHLGRANHCDFFRKLEVDGVYDHFSVHGQLLGFFYLIMIDVHVYFHAN